MLYAYHPSGGIGDVMVERGNMAIAIGAVLLMVNAFGLTTVVDGLVESGVQDNVQASMDEESDFGEEWLTSKSERVYFAYNITDTSSISTDDPSSNYDYMGPFIYDVTTHREILNFDNERGEITYSEYDTFEWCETCTWNGTHNGVEGEHSSLSGDTEITQVNILWNTQRMAGVSTGITYGETFAKAGFANQVIKFELENLAPSIWAAHEIAGMTEASSQNEIMSGWFNAIGAQAPDWENDSSLDGLPELIIGELGEPNALGARPLISGAKDLSTGESTCIALSCNLGPLVFAGMGAPSETVTALRSALYGYEGHELEATIDAAVYAGSANAFVSNGGGASIDNFSSVPVDNLRDRLKEVTKAALCPATDFGETNYNPNSYCDSALAPANPDVLEYLLFGFKDERLGGLAAGVLVQSDLDGIPIYGTALMLLDISASFNRAAQPYDWDNDGPDGIPAHQATDAAPSDDDGIPDGGYGLAFGTLNILKYVGQVMAQGHLSSLIGETRDIPAIMFGGTGMINADDWWETSFGGPEPLAGGYLSIGLNRGDFEGTVNLAPEKAREILYSSEFALTGDFSRVFIYGEMSGETLPNSEGEVFLWDNAHVASLYGISESEAAALRGWVKDFMFETVIGALLTFQYGSGEYTTMPISNWLYGWSDPVLVGLYGYEDSWASLETNQTYYGSEGLSTGDYSVYVMSTKGDNIGQSLMEGYINSDGETCSYKMVSSVWEKDVDCETNEIYAMTTSMPWRSEYSEEFSYGLLSDHVGNTNTETAGTIGGKTAPLVNDPNSPFRLNVVGYAIGESQVVGDVTFKDIDMVEHTLTLEPSEHQIQAKLIPGSTFVDVIPGALPVYFSAESTFRVDRVAGALMYGDVTATFHLDLRGPGSTDPDFSEGSVDTHPVFVIKSFSEIDDEGASDYRGSVTDTMGLMGWTSLGGDVGGALTIAHAVIGLLYIASLGTIGYGVNLLVKKED